MHEDIKKFLQEKMTNPYNKYCIDCKKNQTTHFVLWLGVFVCEQCANLHKSTFGGNQYSYIKDVYNEHWDDYQLRSVALGGNQQLFQIMKEYGIDNQPQQSKYRHACVNWYRRRHVALMDGLPFSIENNPKPPKDLEERFNQTKNSIIKGSAVVGSGLSNLFATGKEVGYAGGMAAAEKASVLKEKIQTKEWGTKVMGMFGGKKKPDAPGTMEAAEERKDGAEPEEKQ